MKAVVCETWREWDRMELREVPAPVPRPGQVRLRVEAVGVSFAAQLVVQGKYQRKPPLPFSPGTEVVGTVLEGPIPAGTRVFAALDWGGLAEEAVCDAIHCMPIPDGVPDPLAGVAMAISYPTAASALMWRGKVGPGDWVLVHGAAGGVGLAGLEVAKALGCRVVARAAAAKHALLHERGADVVLDSALPFREAVRAATGGVACVLDILGGDSFDDSLRCLGDGGTLVTLGYVEGRIPQVPANILLLKNIAVAGLNWGTYIGWSPGDGREGHAPRVRALWGQLSAWWAEGKLRPAVHARFPLARFREAMAEVAARRSAGRVIITPSG